MLKKRWVWLVLIFIAGLFLRLIAYGFIKLPWIIYDEFVYLDTARQISAGRALVSGLTRDQTYPFGWPLVLSSFVGYINDPFIQYKLSLIAVMIISSLVPILGYFLFESYIVAGLLTIYPGLFVYSSNIMSETFYTFLLFVSVWVLKLVIKEDLTTKRKIWLSAAVFAFLLYYAYLVRSFAYILLPAVAAAIILYIIIFLKKIPAKQTKVLIRFLILTCLFYLVFQILGKVWLFFGKSHYEVESYTKILKELLNYSYFTKIFLNEVLIVFFSLFWLLPLFLYFKLSKLSVLFKEKKAEEIISFLFALFIFFGSLLLTLLHMLKTVHRDEQYLIFTRYLDPSLVLLFGYALKEFLIHKYLKIERKIFIFYSFLTALLLILFHYFFYFGNYKFGNTMPIYYLTLFKDKWYLLIIIAAINLLILWLVVKKRKPAAVLVFSGFFLIMSAFSIYQTRSVPREVNKQYERFVNVWENFHSSLPLCIVGNDVYGQVYYFYHFLNPGKYLNLCSLMPKNQRHLVLVSSWQKWANSSGCLFYRSLDSGDKIYYCE